MITVYANPQDGVQDLRDFISRFPKSMNSLEQEVQMRYDERITPGRCFATIDGDGQVS